MQFHYQKICEQPESRRLEFKEKFPKGDQVAKTVIAFANGAGGKIIFGVQDHPRYIIGLSDEDIFFLEEKIWKVGRKFYEEGSEELDKWVEKQRELIYHGR